MSDVERPSEEGGNARPNPSHNPQPPARDMADIARLFLQGARPKSDAPAKRTPPARQTPAPRASTPPTPAKKHPTIQPPRVMALLALAAAPRGTNPWESLHRAAQGLAAEQSTTVAIVGFETRGTQRHFVIDIAGFESPEDLPALHADAAGAADLQIARALHSLKPAVGLWIIAAPHPSTRGFAAVSPVLRDWLFVGTTDNAGIVASYQLLKTALTRLKQDGPRPISPAAYLLADDYAHAALVHQRFVKATQEFLKTEMTLAGVSLAVAGGTVAERPVRALTLACDGPEESLWAALLDEIAPQTDSPDTMETTAPTDVEAALEQVQARAADLAMNAGKTATQATAAAMVVDHLANILDPEEKEALSLNFLEDPADDSDAPAAVPAVIPASPAEKPRVVPPVAPKQERPAATAAPQAPSMPGVASLPATPALRDTTSLRVFDLPAHADRRTQWEAVERSIWDLSPRSALLDAKPPMSWATETCISIDASGVLNVWTLFKEAAGGASWFALREWAREHKDLLALTRRDLVISKDADVAVHIVLPLDPSRAESAADPIPLLLKTTARHVHLYRLRTIQWNGKQGLMVVPAG